MPELHSLVESWTTDYGNARVDYLPVTVNPLKALCVGLNYESHRNETGRDKITSPVVFTRFAVTQVGRGQPIGVPRASRRLDYERELAVIVGRGGPAIDKVALLVNPLVAGTQVFTVSGDNYRQTRVLKKPELFAVFHTRAECSGSLTGTTT